MFRVLWEESAISFHFLQILISRFNSAVRFEICIFQEIDSHLIVRDLCYRK